MPSKYKSVAIATHYWRPSEYYLKEILESVRQHIENGDIVTVSEKALATASCSVIDEQKITPNLAAKLLAKFWMRFFWGYILGLICHLKPKTIQYLRAYPPIEGARHKHVALQYAGLLQTLMQGSEGGIDGTNLPYSYVSLPPNRPEEIATQIRNQIKRQLDKTATVIIVDTDKTYSFRNFHFTPRTTSVKGIRSNGGILFYIIGRFLKLEKRATPVAVAGARLSIEELLRISEIANRVRGSGAGRNIWEMAEKFNVGLSDVTWEMLNSVKHKPIVIIKYFT